MYGIRINTAKIFRNLRRATPAFYRTRRARTGGPRINIFLRRRRLRDRPPKGRESSWGAVILAAGFAAVSLGFFVREFGGSLPFGSGLLLAPFAVVALIGIWMSRLPSAWKILWSVPAVALIAPILPLG